MPLMHVSKSVNSIFQLEKASILLKSAHFCIWLAYWFFLFWRFWLVVFW